MVCVCVVVDTVGHHCDCYGPFRCHCRQYLSHLKSIQSLSKSNHVNTNSVEQTKRWLMIVIAPTNMNQHEAKKKNKKKITKLK
jgi:hypothetical protein